MDTSKIPSDGFVIKDVSFGLMKGWPEMLAFGLLLHNTKRGALRGSLEPLEPLEFWVYRSGYVHDYNEILLLCDFVMDTLDIAAVSEIHMLKGKTVWFDKKKGLRFERDGCRVVMSVYKERFL